MLTEKDYCDYETCVALKKLGYNEKTLAYYTSEGFFHWIRAYIYDVAIPDLANSSNKKPYKHIIDAMSLYEAQKWMREVKGIIVRVIPIYEERKLIKGISYTHEVIYWTDGYVTDECIEEYPSYEEALSEGIKEAVKILKNGLDSKR
ncbi:MAG: hypothetical protein J6Q39_07980 [Bacteroidales bacterium]|nr:hypothetical protein [Bacteroidales bacterium]